MRIEDIESGENKLPENIAWHLFWVVINTICIFVKIFHYLSKIKCPEADWDERQVPTRIAFCENGAGYGGAIISLAAYLENRQKDIDPFVYTSIGTEQYAQLASLAKWRHVPPIQLINTKWLKKFRFPFLSSIDNLLNLLPYALRYYLFFKRDRIECVYLNNDASCNFAAAIAAKLARLPTILHARGFNSDTKGNRWVLANLDHCIAVSEAIRTELLSLGVSSEKCTIVPEGINLSVFHPRHPNPETKNALALEDHQQVVTLVGGLVDWKGQDVLIDAAPKIFKSFPNTVILLVGGAYGKDNTYAKFIASRASMPEMRSRIRLLGARNDVADILTCSNIIVHASTTPEPFGRTFLEGMALGKAVIASNEGGPLDVISHESDGLLIQPRDPSLLAEAIIRLISDTELADKIGRNAATKALAYSIENHAAGIFSVLQKVRPMSRKCSSSAEVRTPISADAT